MDTHSWFIFLSLALVATATPGPAVLLITTRSLQSGLRSALLAALGNIGGLLVMCLASISGLSLLIIYSTSAFTILKFIGAAYLIYLGVKTWRGVSMSDPACPPHTARRQSHWIRPLAEGFMIAATNPKAILFTTALFPQFVDRAQPLAPQFSALVSTLMALSFICLRSYAIAAQRMKGKIKLGQQARRLIATVYVCMGAAIASTSN